ncbi:hypothetical protein LXA43DRAFT_1067732 [Ganoderma leucocontextum]|nr:hypothetical protein LXA43DRAFT_1067732 [Ganoderma leucocontextum]
MSTSADTSFTALMAHIEGLSFAVTGDSVRVLKDHFMQLLRGLADYHKLPDVYFEWFYVVLIKNVDGKFITHKLIQEFVNEYSTQSRSLHVNYFVTKRTRLENALNTAIQNVEELRDTDCGSALEEAEFAKTQAEHALRMVEAECERAERQRDYVSKHRTFDRKFHVEDTEEVGLFGGTTALTPELIPSSSKLMACAAGTSTLTPQIAMKPASLAKESTILKPSSSLKLPMFARGHTGSIQASLTTTSLKPSSSAKAASTSKPSASPKPSSPMKQISDTESSMKGTPPSTTISRSKHPKAQTRELHEPTQKPQPNSGNGTKRVKYEDLVETPDLVAQREALVEKDLILTWKVDKCDSCVKRRDKNIPWAVFNGGGHSIYKNVPNEFLPWLEACCRAVESSSEASAVTIVRPKALAMLLKHGKFRPSSAGLTQYQYNPATLPKYDPRKLPKYKVIPQARPMSKARSSSTKAASSSKSLENDNTSSGEETEEDELAESAPEREQVDEEVEEDAEKPDSAEDAAAEVISCKRPLLHRASTVSKRHRIHSSSSADEDTEMAPNDAAEDNDMEPQTTRDVYHGKNVRSVEGNNLSAQAEDEAEIHDTHLVEPAEASDKLHAQDFAPGNQEPAVMDDSDPSAMEQFITSNAAAPTMLGIDPEDYQRGDRNTQAFATRLQGIRSMHQVVLSQEVMAQALRVCVERTEMALMNMPFGEFHSAHIHPYNIQVLHAYLASSANSSGNVGMTESHELKWLPNGTRDLHRDSRKAQTHAYNLPLDRHCACFSRVSMAVTLHSSIWYGARCGCARPSGSVLLTPSTVKTTDRRSDANRPPWPLTTAIDGRPALHARAALTLHSSIWYGAGCGCVRGCGAVMATASDPFDAQHHGPALGRHSPFDHLGPRPPPSADIPRCMHAPHSTSTPVFGMERDAAVCILMNIGARAMLTSTPPDSVKLLRTSAGHLGQRHELLQLLVLDLQPSLSLSPPITTKPSHHSNRDHFEGVPHQKHFKMSHNQYLQQEVYTFADETKHIYTVVNLPPSISIPTLPDPNMVENKDLRRLCLDNKILIPIEFEDGRWGLCTDLMREWTQIEKGLWFISDVLFEKAAQNPIIAVFRALPNWPKPYVYRYCETHHTYGSARASILRSRDAFMLLAARCSLALCLWLPVPKQKPKGKKDPGTVDGVVPPWIPVLEKASVLLSWIDLLQWSIVTDFSPKLHVGIFLSQQFCPDAYLRIVPNMIRANLPVFVHWKDPSATQNIPPQYAFLQDLIPVSDDAHLVNNHCTLPLFLLTTNHPRAHIRWLANPVYQWVNVGDLHIDTPAIWRDLEYRISVHPGHITSVWRLYSRTHKKYNAYFDEWDLWTDGTTTSYEVDEEFMELDKDNHNVLAIPTPAQLNIGEILEEVKLTRFAGACTASFPESRDYRKLWYGFVTVKGTEQDPPLRERQKEGLAVAFGMDHKIDRFLPDEEAVAHSWVTGIKGIKDKKAPPIFAQCWDLELVANHFLLWRPSTEVVRGGFWLQARTTNLPNHPRVYKFGYNRDPKDQKWSLLIDAVAILFLLRKPNVAATRNAIIELIGAGASFHTVIHRDARPPNSQPKPATRKITYYRRHDRRPDGSNYRQYRLAAMEFMSESDALWNYFIELVWDSPTEDAFYQQPLTTEGDVDDALSEDELFTFCGLYKVYTAFEDEILAVALIETTVGCEGAVDAIFGMERDAAVCVGGASGPLLPTPSMVNTPRTGAQTPFDHLGPRPPPSTDFRRCTHAPHSHSTPVFGMERDAAVTRPPHHLTTTIHRRPVLHAHAALNPTAVFDSESNAAVYASTRGTFES